MKKIIVFLLLICITPSIFSQEKVLEFPKGFQKSQSQKKSHSISNQLNGDLILLLEESNKLSVSLLDSLYRFKANSIIYTINPKHKNILGFNALENNTYAIFFSNTKNTKFGVQVFDFDSNISKTIPFDFKIKGEKYVESINYKNKIYIITITRNSSNFNIYTFDEEFTAKKEVVSLKGLKFPVDNTQYAPKSLYEKILVFRDNYFFGTSTNILKIESQNLNTIDITSSKNKLYHFQDKLVLSFDGYDMETQLCFIDLTTFKSEIKSYAKPTKSEEGFKKNNSYLFDNKLFQIASSNKKMKFTVLDLETEKTIKEYAISKEDSINFKNTPISWEVSGIFGTSKTKTRETEKTSKYLKNISSGDLGISVYKIADQYNIILGGTEEKRYYSTGSGLGDVSGSGFVSVDATNGNFLGLTSGFNNTFQGYHLYTITKSTHITGLFDKNFEHLKGDISKNVFDKVEEFEDTLEKKTKAVNIFLHNDILHYGYYDKLDAVYKLYTFDK